ncbi:hypothetical protein K435DRAFT_972603 [Dendrothele bispora CBS 962.96]|uniref:Uncharacterized protein n=1 Tax=Dendrothele bispora (strain CBS 962.96) TaxID=1314807 RepID=A0A4S8KXT8_DENBC|nr:hypothetical protein K435DRAFT_972603 [Dendrothele bispora CBS 962.96]
MLFLYALAHPLPSLLSLTNESLPSPEASLEALNSCSDINSCRTVEEILYSCLAVVFACTWVAIHPNIPRRFEYDVDDPDEIEDSFTISSARVFAQDVITMILSLLAPELIVLWALRQWFASRQIAKKYSQYGWTKTHGHFLIMGGFALFEDGRYKCTLADKDEFELFMISGVQIEEQNIRHQIESQNSQGEKTKRSPEGGRPEDYNSQSGDPLHPDDSTQDADAPQSESVPLSVPSGEPSEATCLLEFLIQHKYIEITEDEINAKSKTDFLTKSIAVVQTTWFILQCIARKTEGLVVTDLEIVTVAFALLNIATYVLWWNKPQRIRYPVKIDYCRSHTTSKVKVKDDRKGGVNVILAIPWKSFTGWIEETWEESNEHSWPVHVIRFLLWDVPRRNTFSDSILNLSIGQDSYQTGLEDIPLSLDFTIISLFLVFGAIHCTPWNSTFPTPTEQLLWRVSAVTVTAFPLVWFPLFGVYQFFDDYHDDSLTMNLIDTVANGIIVIFLLPLAYIWARITLIVIAFTELRALPPSAYQTVDWARFIPHI